MEKQAWTIGESVVVKPGVSDPDTGRDIGSWQGRIGNLFEEEETVMIHWDRLTLEKRRPLRTRCAGSIFSDPQGPPCWALWFW